MIWRLTSILAVAFGASSAFGQRVLSTEEAKPILDGFYKLIHDAKSIHVSETVAVGTFRLELEHWLLQPRHYKVFMTGRDGSGKPTDLRTYMDDKDVYTIDMKAKSFVILDRAAGSPFIAGFESFTQPDRPKYTTSGRVTETNFNKRLAYSIEIGVQDIPGSFSSVIIDHDSLIPIASSHTWHNSTQTATYSVRLNEPMQPKDFTTQLPKGFRLQADMRKKTQPPAKTP